MTNHLKTRNNHLKNRGGGGGVGGAGAGAGAGAGGLAAIVANTAVLCRLL